MNRIITICAAVLMTASVFAQSPEKMSYQAVIRDSADGLVTNTQVGMQISILQGTASGSAVYVETQTPTTNVNEPALILQILIGQMGLILLKLKLTHRAVQLTASQEQVS